MRLLQPFHGNVAAVDPIGARRGDKCDHIGDLLGGAEAAHRKAVADIVGIVFRIGEAVAIPGIAVDQVEPGEMVLTRMPCGTNSSAQRSVSKMSAALAAPY